MVDFDQAYSAFISRMGTVWPDCLPKNGGGGFQQAEHASMVDWGREVLPFGVLVIDPERGAPMTMDSLVFRQVVEIWRVDYTKGGASGLRQNLQSLIVNLWPDPPADVTDLDYGQIEDVIGYSYADSLRPNFFFRQRGATQRAGRIELAYLVG